MLKETCGAEETRMHTGKHQCSTARFGHEKRYRQSDDGNAVSFRIGEPPEPAIGVFIAPRMRELRRMTICPESRQDRPPENSASTVARLGSSRNPGERMQPQRRPAACPSGIRTIHRGRRSRCSSYHAYKAAGSLTRRNAPPIPVIFAITRSHWTRIQYIPGRIGAPYTEY